MLNTKFKVQSPNRLENVQTSELNIDENIYIIQEKIRTLASMRQVNKLVFEFCKVMTYCHKE